MTSLLLTDNDTRTLLGFLNDRLQSVQFEAARTEARDYRHMLIVRQELIERLIPQLNPAMRTTPDIPTGVSKAGAPASVRASLAPDIKVGQSGSNRFNELHARFDQMSDELRAATDLDQRQSIVRRLHKIIEDMDAIITDEALRGDQELRDRGLYRKERHRNQHSH